MTEHKNKPFTIITVVLLALIALAQLTRFAFGWQVAVEGLTIPLWASAIAFVVAAGLTVMVWLEARRP
jgi:hypothetical protein